MFTSGIMDPHALYQSLNLSVFPLPVFAEERNGEQKKSCRPPKNWENAEPGWRDYPKSDEIGYALRTGKTSGCTAIDIDDPTLEKSVELMALMDQSCKMIQETLKGYHYIYKYDPEISQTQTEFKIDVRNDKGMLFVAPTRVIASTGEPVADYRWKMAEALVPMPAEVKEFLAKLSPKFVRRQKAPAPTSVAVATATPTATPTAAPTATPTPTESQLPAVVNALPIKFLDNYDEWVKIGMIFHTEGLDVASWVDVSKRSSKYCAGDCEKKWISFDSNRDNKLRAATLWKWLKESNPNAFWKMSPRRTDVWELIKYGTIHYNTAEFFLNMRPDSYLWNQRLGWYSAQTNNTWLSHGSKTPPSLKTDIAQTLQRVVHDTRLTLIDEYREAMKDLMEEAERKQVCADHNAKMKELENALRSFGSSDFGNGVIAYLSQLYNVEDLDKKLDQQRHLLAFSDGVYDLNEGLFREIRPSDYISTTTGYSFPRQSDEAVREKIMTLVHAMFDDADVPDFLIAIFALCLYGGNKHEEFYVLTGKGGNGKGVLTDLLQKTFGDYYLAVANSLLTKENDKKDSPNPALVEARVKRVLMTSEPEAESRLQCGLIKQLSGGDEVSVRTLYSQNNITYVPQYKVFLQTNFIPKLSKLDGGIERRLVVVDFPHQFKRADELVGTYPANYRVADPEVKDKLCKSDAWRDEFMLMLIDKWSHIKNLKSLRRPQSVQDVTKQYISDNNPVGVWLREHYEITNVLSDSVEGLLAHYNQHMVDQGKVKMSNPCFRQAMDNNNIQQKRSNSGTLYLGLRLKTNL